MYHPTTRALAVLALLQSHGRMTGAELARRLEVNVRTVRDYITILQDLGAPIVAERGRNGAYELDSGFKLPPMMFTDDEALALAVGLAAARHLGLAEMVHAIESARTKLEQVMPVELTNRVRALAESITLDLNGAAMPFPSTVMLTLSSAAQLRQRVRMRYRSRQDDETQRDFDPYGLAYRQGKWYVVGHCGLRHGLRSFRLDRVMEIELTETHFERPQHFDTLLHVVQAIATLPRPFTFEVLLKTDLVRAQQEIFGALGVLEPRGDGVLMRGSTESLDWVARELARLPFDFVVYEPEALRDELRQRAAQLVRLADAH